MCMMVELVWYSRLLKFAILNFKIVELFKIKLELAIDLREVFRFR